MASIAAVESGVGRLQCVNSTIDLIQAQAKEARVILHQYQNQGDYLQHLKYITLWQKETCPFHAVAITLSPIIYIMYSM